MLYWNRALWLDVTSHMTSFNQSKCFISAKNSYAMLKIISGIGARERKLHWALEKKFQKMEWDQIDNLNI